MKSLTGAQTAEIFIQGKKYAEIARSYSGDIFTKSPYFFNISNAI